MNATRRHGNVAEYSENTILHNANGTNTGAHVNLEWMAKLRSKKGERRKNNTHIRTPNGFKTENSIGK